MGLKLADAQSPIASEPEKVAIAGANRASMFDDSSLYLSEMQPMESVRKRAAKNTEPKEEAPLGSPCIYGHEVHQIDPSLLDRDAIWTVSQLRQAGHEAYLVGGSVRDLLLAILPKDYDISTSAQPEEIKQLFGRRCILIGRRFRLAHLRFGRKIIEVATFRSGDQEQEELIVHDNAWGSAEEDVMRRDFTINGLLYDPERQLVIDYVGGWADLRQRTLATIGKPEARFKQDPVRMIRLLKFQARLGFSIADESQKALENSLAEIHKSSSARLLEELLRMLESGASAPFFRLLADVGMLELLMPCLHRFQLGSGREQLYAFLAAADQLNSGRERGPLDRTLLTSCLLFPIVESELRSRYLETGETPHLGDILLLTQQVTDAVMTSSFSHFPRRISTTMNLILAIQWRMTPFSGKKRHQPKMMRTKEFALALQFLKLRSLVDPLLEPLYRSWKEAYLEQKRQSERLGHQRHPPPEPK